MELLPVDRIRIGVKRKKLIKLYYQDTVLDFKIYQELCQDLVKIKSAQNHLFHIQSVVEKIMLRYIP